jgi:hypothetical protein
MTNRELSNVPAAEFVRSIMDTRVMLGIAHAHRNA